MTVTSLLARRQPIVAIDGPSQRALPGFHAEVDARNAALRLGSAFAATYTGTANVSCAFASMNATFAGASHDLAFALAAWTRTSPRLDGRRILAFGELGLDGTVRPIRGLYAAIAEAGGIWRDELLVCPAANVAEVRAFAGQHNVVPVRTLADALLFVDRGLRPRIDHPTPIPYEPAELPRSLDDWPELGALTEAVRGGESVLLVGRPIAGSTMLARWLADQLPGMDEPTRRRTGMYWSEAGIVTPDREFPPRRPPFRAPHHTVSEAGMRGARHPHCPYRPGEIVLAHGGVLFLDEVTEFTRPVLAAIAHARRTGYLHAGPGAPLPVRFRLIGATTPCPCVADRCTCSPEMIARHMNRIPTGMFDRTFTIPSPNFRNRT